MPKKDEFEFFCEEVNKCIKKLGLTDWKVNIRKEDEDDSIGDVWAKVYYNIVSMKATIIFAKQNTGRSVKEIKITALHEVIHLLLSDLTVMATARTWDEDLFESAEHKIVNRLINIIGE